MCGNHEHNLIKRVLFYDRVRMHLPNAYRLLDFFMVLQKTILVLFIGWFMKFKRNPLELISKRRLKYKTAYFTL